MRNFRLTTIFTITIIVSFFYETFHDLNYTLMIIIYRIHFCEKGCCAVQMLLATSINVCL
jgi:hypothetical protein